MLRLIGFFILVFVLMGVLQHVPILGGVFRVPFLGFWVTAIILSAVLSRLAVRTIDRRRFKNFKHQLGAVEMPHNLGKLGMLLLKQGQYRQAISQLEQACAGEPESAEWNYGLGCALLGARRPQDAIALLERAAKLEEEYAYGNVQLRLAEALTKASDLEQALVVLDRFERNHGPKPESVYRRGSVLRALGRNSEARTCFREVSDIARQATSYQRRSSRVWTWRAFLAGLR